MIDWPSGKVVEMGTHQRTGKVSSSEFTIATYFKNLHFFLNPHPSLLVLRSIPHSPQPLLLPDEVFPVNAMVSVVAVEAPREEAAEEDRPNDRSPASL